MLSYSLYHTAYGPVIALFSVQLLQFFSYAGVCPSNQRFLLLLVERGFAIHFNDLLNYLRGFDVTFITT